MVFGVVCQSNVVNPLETDFGGQYPKKQYKRLTVGLIGNTCERIWDLYGRVFGANPLVPITTPFRLPGTRTDRGGKWLNILEFKTMASSCMSLFFLLIFL